jgi:hypothetical protein
MHYLCVHNGCEGAALPPGAFASLSLDPPDAAPPGQAFNVYDLHFMLTDCGNGPHHSFSAPATAATLFQTQMTLIDRCGQFSCPFTPYRFQSRNPQFVLASAASPSSSKRFSASQQHSTTEKQQEHPIASCAAAMPVPIAVTHPTGAGLKAAQPATLDTAGPFARLAAKEAAERAAAEQQQQQQGSKDQQQLHQQQQSPTQQQQQQPQTHAEQNGVCANGAQEQQPTIVVDHLDFSYPGLGR